MKSSVSLALAAASASFFLCPAQASASVLTFAGNICNGGGSCGAFSPIDQSYGDQAGVDVQYRYDSTLAADAANSLQYWPNNYNNLVDVAFGTPGSNGASIFFAPAAGYSVTLNSFDIGAYSNRIGASSQYTIFDGLGNTLYSSGAILVGLPGNIANSYLVGLTSSNGIGLKWGPESYNVGVDNIDFSVQRIGAGGVPEPATWAMMLLGMGAIGFAMRRQPRPESRVRFAV